MLQSACRCGAVASWENQWIERMVWKRERDEMRNWEYNAHKDLFMCWRKTQTEGGPPARPAARDFHTYLSKKLNSAAPSFLLLFFQMKIFQSFILPLRLWTADCILYVHIKTLTILYCSAILSLCTPTSVLAGRSKGYVQGPLTIKDIYTRGYFLSRLRYMCTESFFSSFLFLFICVYSPFSTSRSGEPWRETAGESILKSDDPHQRSHWGDCFQEDLYLMSTLKNQR